MNKFLRVVTGAVSLLLVGGVTYGSDLLAGPDAGEVEAETVEITPLSVPLVCPGPAQLADSDEESTGDPAFDPSPVDTDASTSGVVLTPPPGNSASQTGSTGLEALGGGTQTGLTGGPDAEVGSVSDERPDDNTEATSSVLWAGPGPDGVARAAATTSSRTPEGDLRGLAASSCAIPGTEQWLVGGSTVLGASTRLVLQNPSRTPATVQIEAWGTTGPIELAGPSTFTVPARGQTATLLEGLAAEQRRLTIRVESSGAEISSYLQVNELEGIRPLGVEFVTSSGTPSTRQVLTGLVAEGKGTADGMVQLRALAPGGTATEATVTILGPHGRVLLPGAEKLALAPGSVADLSLAGLDAGTYAVVLEADEPFVAGATFTRHAAVEETAVEDKAGEDAPAEDTASGKTSEATAPQDFAHVSAQSLLTPDVDPDLEDADVAEQDADLTAQPSGPGEFGAIALPRGLAAQVTLLAVPEQLDEIPGILVGDKPSDDNEAEPSTVEAVLHLINEDGRVNKVPTTLVPGYPTSLNLSDLPRSSDTPITGIHVEPGWTGAEPGADQVLAWGVTVSAEDGAFVSSLRPVLPVNTRSQMLLRPGQNVGLTK